VVLSICLFVCLFVDLFVYLFVSNQKSLNLEVCSRPPSCILLNQLEWFNVPMNIVQQIQFIIYIFPIVSLYQFSLNCICHYISVVLVFIDSFPPALLVYVLFTYLLYLIYISSACTKNMSLFSKVQVHL
jgi:hypothetical protein